MKWTDALTKAIAAVLPWAPKHERRAAIDAARAEKEHSRGNAAESRQVRQQLTRLAYDNHFADSLRNTLRQKGGQ